MTTTANHYFYRGKTVGFGNADEPAYVLDGPNGEPVAGPFQTVEQAEDWINDHR